MSALHPSDRFGPWADGISDAERRARLRSLRAIVGLCCGPRGAALVEALRHAEIDPAALIQASDELRLLASLDRRRVLASYGALHEASLGSGRPA
ncbi:MAG: hypothetical protein K2X71_06225 [Methylobacterium sp.]|uniref:hypothetical protein n=1 Tax=Methylobacterium sp. TaxID=409 RepID=UPI002589BAA8|nr:hypothetical protein [Methylobacterium sp.]MBY0295621.1 hypothetical protein [Methylobacterium sp.]